MLHLSKDSGVSDFYITPWEPLTYKRNGKLFFDSFIYQPERPLEFSPAAWTTRSRWATAAIA
jgi:twitching motility protein PilT